MPKHRRLVQWLLGLTVFCALFAGGLWVVASFREGTQKDLWGIAMGSSLFQVFFGLVALIAGIVGMVRAGLLKAPMAWFVTSTLGGLVLGAGGVVGFVISAFASSPGAGFGGGWGRPLRIRGESVSPELKAGNEWAKGALPNASALNAATRTLLATLWHRDATKEHSSVPAFCRIGWVLAGLGAPAELLEGAAKSTAQEIDHTRRCLALAGGYCGTPQTVEPMPKLLTEGLGMGNDPVRAGPRSTRCDFDSPASGSRRFSTPQFERQPERAQEGSQRLGSAVVGGSDRHRDLRGHQSVRVQRQHGEEVRGPAA